MRYRYGIVSLVLFVIAQLGMAATAGSSEATPPFKPDLQVTISSISCSYYLDFDGSAAFVPPDGFIYEYRRTGEGASPWISGKTTEVSTRLPANLEAGTYEARAAATWGAHTSAWSDTEPFQIYSSKRVPSLPPHLWRWEEIAGDIEIEYLHPGPGGWCPGSSIESFVVANRRLLSSGWGPWEYTSVDSWSGVFSNPMRFEADAEVHQVKAYSVNSWGRSRWSDPYTIDLP